MRFQVLHAEVGLGLILIRPWPAHKDFVAVHCLLQVCAEFLKHVIETARDAGVLAGLGNLLSLHHFFEQCIEQLLPVLFAQCGRQQVELFNTGLLECCLGKEAFGVQLDALAVDVKKP